MKITGKIVSKTTYANEISSAISPDNGGFMECHSEGNSVCAEFTGDSPKTVLATVDDYLMNLSVAWGVADTTCKEQKKTQ